VLAVLAICAALLMAMPAHAATSTVAACDEAALRAAVDDATPGDTITFGCSGTITLTAAAGGPIGIAKNLTIDGSGQSVTISGGGSVGVIEVGPGVTVTLRALTIANGGGYGIYGGILNAGTLNLVESTVSNNAAPAGTGGIRNWGTLNITGSTITGNSGIVGGVHQFNGTLNITESIFSGNIGATTTDYLTTGAIVLSNGSATVTGSTFVGNVGHVAGGINMGFGTTLTVTNSTFSGNASRSLDSAGAIWNDYGSLAVTNSTIVDNFAPHSLYGGNAWFNAGGIVSFPVAPITLANSILAGNEGEFGGNCMFGPGVSDAGGNLSDDISCGFTQGSSGNNVASLNLGPLGDNGGPTPTIALGAGSAAIDAGSCLQATDQRGLPRPGAGSTLCDSGAFELQGDIAPAPQVITFTSTAPTDAVYGGTYEVSATGGGSGNPILFSIDASASNVCSVTGSTVSFIGTGTCTVNANQAGDANYLAAAEVSQGFTVSQAPQVITFAALSDRTFGELDFSVAASASSGLAVTFSATGDCTVSGTTVHLTGAGVCTINANQAGDANYLAAPQVSQGFTVSQAPQVITFAALSDRTFGDPDFSVAASASSGLAVTFSATGECTVSGTTVHLTGAGVCTVNADQAGDVNYLAAAEVSQGFTVSQAPQVITFAALSDRTFGELDFSVAASASSGLAVTFSATGYCTVSGTTVHLIAAGVCTINANQAGDVNYAPAPSVGQSFLIASADLTPPVLTATQNPSPNSAGWNNSDVTVTWTCTDVGSGVDPAASSLGDGVMTASGTAEASCTDLAGNTVSESHAVFIDKTAPVLTATQSPSANASGWNNADVTVSWNCTDVDSEVDEEASSLGDDVMTASGTAEASCTDLAGNTVSESHAVLIDKTAPVLAATQSPLANANGWNDTDVTVSWNCTDVDSEVDEEASSLGDDVMTASGTAEASCTDLAGNTVSASHAVLIDKTAPVLTIASPLDLSVHAVGVVLTFSSDDATSGVDTTAAMLSGGTGGNSVEVQSGYVITAAGVYTLTVTATDLAGNVETQSRMFTVYDPTAGFVTGGGWITSPAGAYLDAPSLLGKATFGFVSRYKKGANVPTGKTQFKFNAAGLDFESVSYEWLVVAGNKAQFKGTGTINGAGDYAFFLTAMDGDGSGGTGVDRFRIRIWDRTSGGLIYDNQVNAPADADPTTALGGGSIVIHK
jgi:surface antigen